jgi:hypothetical protein
MSQRSGWNELEVEVTVPARVFAEIRRRYLEPRPDHGELRVMGSREEYPHPMTGRAPIARKITGITSGFFGRTNGAPTLRGPTSVEKPIRYNYGAPAEDFAINAAAFAPGAIPTVTTGGQPAVGTPRRLGYKPAIPGVTVANVRKFLALVRPEEVGAPRRADFVGALAWERDGATNTAMLPRAGGELDPAALDRWWTSGPDGERPIRFQPRKVLGYAGPEDAAVVGFASPQLVLVRDPHPWIPAEYLPPAAGPYVALAQTNGEIRRYRPVKVRSVYVSKGERHTLRDTGHGLQVWYEEASSGNFLDSSLGRAFVQVGAGALGVLTGGFGLAAAGAIQGAAFSGSAASGALTAAQAVAVNPGAYVQAGYGATLAGASVGSAIAPEETAKALAEIAKASTFLADFDGIFGAIGREIAITLQTDPRRRDRLRFKLAELKAMVKAKGGVALELVQELYAAVKATVTAGAVEGLAAAEQAVFKYAEKAASALAEYLETRNSGELTRIAYAEAERLFQDWLARELEALGGPLNAASSPEPEVKNGSAEGSSLEDRSPDAEKRPGGGFWSPFEELLRW